MDKIIFLILGTISLLPVCAALNKSYTCDGDLKLKCPQGEIIIFAIKTEKRFITSICDSGRSEPTNPTLKAAIWDNCSGKTQCTVNTGITKEEKKYVQVVYDCGTGFNMCSKNSMILANSSYLRSPKNFVFNAREDCECDAKLEEPAQLSVWVVDQRFNVTKPKLTITWLNKTETIEETNKKNTVKNFRIAFTSNHQAGSGTFLLKFKADKEIRLVCNTEVIHQIDLGTILIAPIAMVALLIVIAILFFIVKGIRKWRKRRLQVGPDSSPKNKDEESDSKPDLLNYGATEVKSKEEYAMTDMGFPKKGGESMAQSEGNILEP